MTPAAVLAALAVAAVATPSHKPPATQLPSPPPAAAALAAPAGPVTIYRMQQIATGALPREVMAKMEPLHTLDDVEALLKANKIGFAWREADVSSAQIAPEVLRQLATLPPHEVFVAPQGQGWIISVILDQRPAAPGELPAAPAPAPPPKR